MFFRKTGFFWLFIAVLAGKGLAQTPPAPAVGWYPNTGSTTTYHYHVKSAWYDTRIVTMVGGQTRGLIGFTYKETGSASYYYPYDYTKATETSMAGGVYSTLLASLTTGQELCVHFFTKDPVGAWWLFDAAQIGPPN